MRGVTKVLSLEPFSLIVWQELYPESSTKILDDLEDYHAAHVSCVHRCHVYLCSGSGTDIMCPQPASSPLPADVVHSFVSDLVGEVVSR